MDPIDKLTNAFIKFPGIGPRQARRFVSFLLAADQKFLKELSEGISNLEHAVHRCSLTEHGCGRHFIPRHAEAKLCRVCADEGRNREILMIVEKDVDVDHFDRSGAYRGSFFVLGGTLPILEKNPEEKIRLEEAKQVVADRVQSGVLKEIILALSTNVEGEETASFLHKNLRPIIDGKPIAISFLGRGLSSGAEIEYADMETLKNALKNRSSR